MQDAAGTARGRWYFDAMTNEDHHLALVHGNCDRPWGAISRGTSVPGVPPGVYSFTPAPSGRLNTDFSLVIPGGAASCHESPLWPTLHILVELPTATTLRIEGRTGGSSGDPASWSLSAAAVSFQR